MKKCSLLLFFVLLFFNQLFAAPVTSTVHHERILNFDSDIVVKKDSSVIVTETIKVVVAAKKIKRGIVRRFPTTYKNRLGETKKVGFDVLLVLKNGQPSPYHIKKRSNGVSIYVGKKNVYIKPGVYTYTIRYKTNQQIGYFKEYDELYWNVTGNNWAFPIENAKATMRLPQEAKIIKYMGYTGRVGERGQAYTVNQEGQNEISFTTTQALFPKQGFTIAVAWPKGIVYEPTLADRLNYFYQDNTGLAMAGGLLLIIFFYYFFAWLRVGKDPESGTIIPLFEPPSGFSPAALRFIRRMGFDNKAFASAIVSMGVKGYLIIKEFEDEYTLERTDKGEDVLSNGEKKIAKELFSGRKTLKLENKNHLIVSGAIDALRKSLKKEFQRVYFITNSVYLAPAFVLTIFAIIAIVLSSDNLEQAGFFAIWLSIWTLGTYGLTVSALSLMKTAFSTGQRWGKALFALLLSLPFLGGEIVGIAMFAQAVGMIGVILILAIVLMNAVFYHLMKVPTLRGRQLIDKIEGFKQYLSVTEKYRLEHFNPPNKTPELFEKYLPFAMALNVENEWAEQFHDVLNKASIDQQYSPRWYHGTSWNNFGSRGFTTALGTSLATSIASSATAPGSSSGSGGGGFSGGGGGGGGGGGW